MPHFIDTSDPEFDSAFERFLFLKREAEADVDDVVRTIIEDVRRRGVSAVLDLTSRFDRVELTAGTIAISEEEIDEAVARVSDDDRAALELAGPAEFGRITNARSRTIKAGPTMWASDWDGGGHRSTPRGSMFRAGSRAIRLLS